MVGHVGPDGPSDEVHPDLAADPYHAGRHDAGGIEMADRTRQQARFFRSARSPERARPLRHRQRRRGCGSFDRACSNKFAGYRHRAAAAWASGSGRPIRSCAGNGGTMTPARRQEMVAGGSVICCTPTPHAVCPLGAPKRDCYRSRRNSVKHMESGGFVGSAHSHLQAVAAAGREHSALYSPARCVRGSTAISDRWFGNLKPASRNRAASKDLKLVTAANGTLAIQAALIARCNRASESRNLCLLPAFTFAGTVSAVIGAGLVPMFVDVDSDDLRDRSRSIARRGRSCVVPPRS